MILSKLKKMRDVFLSVTPNTHHYEAPSKQKGSYIIWCESGENDSLHIDDRKDQQVLQGTVDYYTKEEYDPNIDAVQDAMNANGISFTLNSVQYEEETKYIHYEWVWVL